MNIPNFASCHQAMRFSRVAACCADDEDSDTSSTPTLDPGSIPEVVDADSANAPAAPSCLRNDRLELSFQSIIVIAPVTQSAARAGSPIMPPCWRGNYRKCRECLSNPDAATVRSRPFAFLDVWALIVGR